MCKLKYVLTISNKVHLISLLKKDNRKNVYITKEFIIVYSYIENIKNKDNILMLNNEIMKIIENDLFRHQSVFIKMVYSVSR